MFHVAYNGLHEEIDGNRITVDIEFVYRIYSGGYSVGDPPLPIPNREVKPYSADGTAERWESR